MNFNDPFLLILLAALAVLVFFTFRNGRKRQREAAEMQDKILPGAQVMTNFGVFGTIVSKDDEENKVALETTPGTVLSVHRQTIARVITEDDHNADDTVAKSEKENDPQQPLYGERRPDGDDDSTAPRTPVDE